MKLSRNYLWYIFRLYVVETKSHAKIIGVYIKYFYVIQPTYTPKYTRNVMQYKLVYFETKKKQQQKTTQLCRLSGSFYRARTHNFTYYKRIRVGEGVGGGQILGTTLWLTNQCQSFMTKQSVCSAYTGDMWCVTPR